MRISNAAQSGFRVFAFGLLVVFTPAAALAADRNHAPHEHGVSQITLAIEGNSVQIGLHSPGADIVGFEHTPASDADRAAVAKAAGILAKGGELFVPASGAACRLSDADVKAPGLASTDHDHDHKKEHEHEHKTEHKHEHEKAGHTHTDADKHVEDGHSEFQAQYRFNCKNIEKLTHFDVKLFERFPGAQQIKVQAVTPAGQFVRNLKPGSARLGL